MKDKIGDNNINSITPMEALELIDPETAAQFHPNDTRRIITCLKIYVTTEKLPS